MSSELLHSSLAPPDRFLAPPPVASRSSSTSYSSLMVSREVPVSRKLMFRLAPDSKIRLPSLLMIFGLRGQRVRVTTLHSKEFLTLKVYFGDNPFLLPISLFFFLSNVKSALSAENSFFLICCPEVEEKGCTFLNKIYSQINSCSPKTKWRTARPMVSR